jgi:nitrogen fixation protein NifX
MSLQRRLRLLSDPSETKPMTTVIRVAFATSNLKEIDQHFGAAESFAIHTIDAETASLLEVIQFGPADMDGNEDKLEAKITALDGCIAVYCQAIGASAVDRLRPYGIQPIKVAARTPLSQLIRALQNELRDGPSAWLARAIERRNPERANRFDLMDAEGWAE